MTTEVGNKLIAEFMGYIHSEDKDMDAWEMANLKYHNDWNQLMRVVEKIEKEGCEVVIGSQMEWINDDQDTIWHQDVNICQDTQDICNVTAKTKIEAVYAAVIQFIEWYNNNSTQTQ